MRTLAWLVVGLVGCGADSGHGGTTHGPLASIVHEAPGAVRLHAVRHRLELADLPVSAWVGLPARGTLELDAALRIPVVNGQRRYDQARGTLRVRCVDHCQLGDDHARLPFPGGDAFGGDVAFSHLDLDGLDVELTVADGHARVTRWGLRSFDVELHVDLDATLAATLGASTVNGCVRFGPTDALAKRDPRLHSLLSLISPTRGPDQLSHVAITGTLAATRRVPRVCGDDGPAPTP